MFKVIHLAFILHVHLSAAEFLASNCECVGIFSGSPLITSEFSCFSGCELQHRDEQQLFRYLFLVLLLISDCAGERSLTAFELHNKGAD